VAVRWSEPGICCRCWRCQR